MALIKDKIKSAENKELLKNPLVRGMLNTIRYAEGTAGEDGYNTRVGGGKFSDLSKKPGKKVYIKSIDNYSSAEGAYQFINSTYNGVAKDLGLTDFSPESQDIAAVELIKRRGALNDILNGNFETAVNKLSPEWASLPKSDGKGTYKNQKVRSIQQLSNVFYKNADYNSSVKPYINTPEEQTYVITTPEVSNLVTPIEISNLAESNETEAVQKAKEELDYKQQQQISQQRFIQDLLTASQVQYIDPNQIAQEDIYNQEQYFQSGGRRMSIPNPRLMQRDNIITPDIDIIDLDDPKNFTIEYLQSPKYRERLINSGYKNVDALINQRVQRVQAIKDVSQTGKPTELQKTYYDFIGKSYNPAGGSGYIGNTNEIITDTQTDRKIPKFYGVGKKGVRAHELGHAENFDTPMNKRDNDQLFHRLKEQQISSDYPIEERNAQEELGYQYQPHNFKPDENKSDLNALRFLLKEQGIYDAGTQNFTKEHLKKLKSNTVKDRLLKNYKEEDLIWLMNNVAQNEEPSFTYAQDGGVQQSQQYLQNWYQNRVLTDPILNQTYQNEKQQYLNQAQSLPSPQYVSNIDDQNTQGTYDYKTGNINLLKTASPLVYTHEGTHKINLPLKDTQSNVNAFSIIGENVIPQNKIENQWIKDNYSQISNYQEVIPRLNAYRQKYQLQPDQVITPELIQQNRQQYLNSADYEDNTDQLYKLFEDEGLSNVLNKVVSVDSNNSYYGQNGGIVKDDQGYWNPNNWGKVVEINSPKITMEGVYEPLLGISNQTGEKKLMFPGENYNFKNTQQVTEYPIKRNKTKRFS